MSYVRPETRPGDILHDPHGVISGCEPMTYLVLSGETDDSDKWIYRCAKFYDGNYWRMGWMGAPVVTLTDGDIARIKRVGSLQTRHVYIPRLLRQLKKFWEAIVRYFHCRYLDWKYGKPFWKQRLYWTDQPK